MSDCLFCKLRDGAVPAEITYRDEELLAFKDIKAQAPMHELVIPTRHISSLSVATAEDAALLGKLMLAGARRARDNGYTDRGYRVVMNAGPDAGQTVFHVHLHVLAGRSLGWPPG
jgi:histidine triad (HIT) family protein